MDKSLMEMKDRTAVITGGASGLGRATALRFLRRGARCAIWDMNEEKGDALVKDLPGDAIFCRVDVSDEKSVESAIEDTVAAFDTIHINCNFAGVGAAARTIGKKGVFPLKLFDSVVRINLIGTFNVLRLCAEKMSKNDTLDEQGSRGCIINTASGAAFEGQIGQSAYSASKAGIVGMTLPIARDLANYGIRCNTIAPGLIATPLVMGGSDVMTPEIRDALGPLADVAVFPKRLGNPDEIAHVAQMLVENDYMNGETVRCDAAARLPPK
ncbi:MAG: SDR family NAD(P)-dependent oxidoreductase [Pseudomonadota bacterium]